MQPDWDDENYMEWAERERLVRQDMEEIREHRRQQQKAENYKSIELEEDKHE